MFFLVDSDPWLGPTQNLSLYENSYLHSNKYMVIWQYGNLALVLSKVISDYLKHLGVIPLQLIAAAPFAGKSGSGLNFCNPRSGYCVTC